MTTYHESTLICTLGGQPQIVTFALDYLLDRSENVRDVFVLHLTTNNRRLQHSLDCLQAEFEDDTYQGRPCRFRKTALRHRGTALSGIRSETEAEAVRQTVFALVTELKQAGRALHLCIAGGPRMMGLMALSAFQLHCSHQDKIWHIFTDPDFLEQAKGGAIMHDNTGRRVRLVQVPVVPWGQYFSMFSAPRQLPGEAMQVQTAWLDQAALRRCQAVWADLTAREREVVRAFTTGAAPQEVAEQLVISIKTVSSHQTSIFAKCRITWELPEDHRLNFRFLHEQFRPFLDSLP